MLYYNNEISQKYPKLLKYFENGIQDENKNISHCLLFWGPDIKSQCELALEVARLLNCSKDGEETCDCLNCRWIKSKLILLLKFIQDWILKTEQMMRILQRAKRI